MAGITFYEDFFYSTNEVRSCCGLVGDVVFFCGAITNSYQDGVFNTTGDEEWDFSYIVDALKRTTPESRNGMLFSLRIERILTVWQYLWKCVPSLRMLSTVTTAFLCQSTMYGIVALQRWAKL